MFHGYELTLVTNICNKHTGAVDV